MAQVVYTAPKAFIKINNSPAGYIKDLSWTENIQRAEIAGIGSLVNQEVPAVKQTNQFSVGQFFIDLQTDTMKAILNRNGGSVAFLNTLILGEASFSIVMYAKKVVAKDGTTKLVTEINPEGKTIASLDDCFVDSQSFNLSEAGIAGFNTTGRYLTPVAFTDPEPTALATT